MTNFYTHGVRAALDKLGAQLDIPTDQTFQMHRETESPATNAPEVTRNIKTAPTEANLSALWDDHDKRVEQKLLPEYDNFTGV